MDKTVAEDLAVTVAVAKAHRRYQPTNREVGKR
jgi:hypothetical protein